MTIFPTDAQAVVDATTYYMANRRPDKGITVDSSYLGRVFTSQSGHEKRNSISRRAKRRFTLSYTNISGPYKTVLENFYRDMQGETRAFEFDLSYIGLSEIVLARFEGSLQTTQVLSTLVEQTSVYTVSFTLVETYS